jgi:hypothetical protein
LAILAAAVAVVLGIAFNLTEEYRLHAVARILASQLKYPGATDETIHVYRNCENVLCTLGLSRPRDLSVAVVTRPPEPRADIVSWHEDQLAELGWDVAPIRYGPIPSFQRVYTASATKLWYRVDVSLERWPQAHLAVAVSEQR